MTSFLLIRHASHDLLGKALAGRMHGVGLNAAGRREALALAERLSRAAVGALYVSPRERARETAAPLAARLQLDPIECAALDEIDFGAWTGRAFGDLARDAMWTQWIERRSLASPPGGEAISTAQRRIVQCITALQTRHEDATVALVSHGDLIKAALAHFLGSSLDALERFEIAPASVSAIAIGRDWAQVKLVNDISHVASA